MAAGKDKSNFYEFFLTFNIRYKTKQNEINPPPPTPWSISL